MVDFNNLMQNKLLLQYMSGAGADISAGKPIGQNVNAITQQNISSQNFMKLLSQMMGDAASPNRLSKATIDGTKLKYETDLSQLQELGWPAQQQSSPQTTSTSAAPTQSQSQSQSQINTGVMSALNPSSSPAISSADLAGLTPEMISQALQFKFMQDELGQKKMSDIVDMIYKGALIDQSKASAERARQSNTLDQPYVGGLTLRQFNALTPDAKEYVLAKQGAVVLGDSDFMTEREWKENAPTERQKFLEGLADDPKLMKIEKELREASRSTINIGERTGIVADVKAKKYFTDPKGLVQDVDKYVSSEEVQNQLFTYADNPQKQEMETVRAKERFIVSKITAAGGEIVDSKLDRRTFVFTVQWPDGETSEVRYAN